MGNVYNKTNVLFFKRSNKKVIYLIMGPFGLFILFRIILPLIWCFDFLINNSINVSHYTIVLLHTFYLFVEGFLIIHLMIYTINLTRRYRKYRQNNSAYIIQKDNEGNRYALIAFFGVVFFFLLNFNTLPIFMKGGSDAIVALGEVQKTKTWFMYGILGIFTTMLLFSIFYIKSYLKKYFYGFILLLVSLVTGKKSALISYLSKFIFVYFLINNKKPSLPLIKIGIGLILSIFFIVYQFARTSGIDFNLLEVFSIFFNLVYSSSTVYLSQFITMNGIEYAQMYSDSLGDFGSIIYILNPFLKFLFGIGIYKAPGPFLGEVLFGYTFPNGVNPTLFFEPIFVFGNYLAIFFSFVNLLIVIMLAKYFIKKIIFNINKSLLLTISFFGLFLSCLSFTNDTLNTIRNLPFVLLPMIWFYFLKFLAKISKRSKYARIYTQ